MVGLAIPHAQAHAPQPNEKQFREQILPFLEPKQYARYLVEKHWSNSAAEYKCLAALWGKESAWNFKAKSKTHDYGIPQRHMSQNSAAEIKDFMNSPRAQIRWGITYIKSRYETPCGALKSWLSRANKNGKGGWY